MDKVKTMDELYSDYKLFYAKQYVELARTKKELFEAVKELSLTDICKRGDFLESFNKKAIELNVTVNDYALIY